MNSRLDVARMEVAVIIVNYCSAELTLRALASLATEQQNPAIELSVVVVENDSGDEARLREGIAESFSSFAQLVVSPVNGGFGAGNNLGVRTLLKAGTRARSFHFLNPDTVVHPGAVLSLARFLEAHPRAGAVGSRFEHADGTPWPFAFRFPTPLGEIESGACLGIISRLLKEHSVARELGDSPEQVDWLSGASIMVRREMLESIGGFDETYFLYFEETDLCRRAKEAGWEVWYVPESRVMHIRGQSTGVTALDTKPQRLPRYWFESRRRYYAKNHGLAYAAAADLAFLAGNGIGTLKNTLQGRPRTPNLLGDLIRQSVVWPQNRAVAPMRNTSVRGTKGA
ncbi:MAG: glycosyl transferase family 2 [Myxococcaceae bacterium]|nr:glycosyl transferase family 2 [Myxococcaceae bacterium]